MTEKEESVLNQIISSLKEGKDINEIIDQVVSFVQERGLEEDFSEESITDMVIEYYNNYLPILDNSDSLDPDSLEADDFNIEDINFDLVLAHLPWYFDKTNYASLSDFEKKLKEIYPEEEDINELYNVIMDYPEVEIQFNYWMDKGETPQELEGEMETQEIFVFNQGVIYKSVLLLHADNGENFTGLELLYKTHQHMLMRDLGDRLIFEGFELIEDKPNRLILGNVN